MQSWVEQNFGIQVKGKMITLSNGTKAFEWVSGEYNDAQKAEIKRSVRSNFNVTPVREATVKYNCHSYAWYSTSLTNTYWIDDPANFRKNWLKSTQWSNVIPSGVQNGDKVDYYISPGNNPHSAIVHDWVNDLFISKWGPTGLYIHKPQEVPDSYTVKEFGYYRP